MMVFVNRLISIQKFLPFIFLPSIVCLWLSFMPSECNQFQAYGIKPCLITRDTRQRQRHHSLHVFLCFCSVRRDKSPATSRSRLFESLHVVIAPRLFTKLRDIVTSSALKIGLWIPTIYWFRWSVVLDQLDPCKMLVNFTSPEVEILVALVQQNPCLYDVQDSRHKDQQKIENIWRSIATALNKDGVSGNLIFSFVKRSS